MSDSDSDSDVHPTRHSPSGDIPATAWSQAFADLRADMRAGLRDLSHRLGKIEETLSISHTESAVSKMKIEEMMTRQALLEGRVNALEVSDRDRKTRDDAAERAAKPRDHGVAYTAGVTAVVTIIVSAVSCWLVYEFATYIAKHGVGP